MKIIRNATGEAVEIIMRKPADLHQHFRQGSRLKAIAPLVAERFATALAMPNTEPPITTCAQAIRYGGDITDAVGEGGHLRLLMTFYLTDKLEPKEVERACVEGLIAGIKYYPRGLTTNSDKGVADPTALWREGTKPYDCLRVLADHDKVLLLHGADGVARTNVTIRTRKYRAGEELDAYDQEPHFVEHSLPHIMHAHQRLRISFEHLSTAEGVEAMRTYGGLLLGCGLTPQHQLEDRRDTHRGGLRPNHFWFPVPQAKEHREELNRFAAEGHSYCYLGSDSAPHYRKGKEADCCVGGVMTAHAGIELYAEAFEKIGALEKLEAFACDNGPRFYGVPPSEEHIRLIKEPWKVTDFYFGEEVVDDLPAMLPMRPFRYGEEVPWKLVR